jgi:hypothetical protein
MANPIPNLWRVPELKNKILFTLFILLIYRVGAHITVPGLDVGALRLQFGQLQDTFLGIYDMFVGGGLSRATIFALGIMPYISASIMFQLLAAVVPTIEKLQKEGEEGRKKITQWTRYTTVLLSAIQAYGYSIFLLSLPGVIRTPGAGFIFTTVLALTVGAIFIMWLGEQITEKGDRKRHEPHDLLLHHRGIPVGHGPDLGSPHVGRDRGCCPGGSPGGDHRGDGRCGGHDHGCTKDPGADPQEGRGPGPDPGRPEELHPPSGELGRRHAHHLCPGVHRGSRDGGCVFHIPLPPEPGGRLSAPDDHLLRHLRTPHRLLHVFLHRHHLQPGGSWRRT